MLFGYLVCFIQSQLYSFPSVNRGSFAVFDSVQYVAKPNKRTESKLTQTAIRMKEKEKEVRWYIICNIVWNTLFSKGVYSIDRATAFLMNWEKKEPGYGLWITWNAQDFSDFVLYLLSTNHK